MQRESIGQTFKVAFLLCLVCSFVVSLSAVGLRGKQQANRERERKKNILLAAGLFDEQQHDSGDVAPLFEQVETRVVNLDDGTYNTDMEPDSFNQLTEANEAQPLPPEVDLAGIRRREEHSLVYLIKDDDGKLDQFVLPIRGKGLWSTLYGFIALDAKSLRGGADQLVVRGLTYYQHGETPGLGGEVTNPRWRAKWNGKKVFDENWNVLLAVAKQIGNEHQVDGLSGATFTTRGVTNMMKFWLGSRGFKPFLERQQRELSGQQPVGGGNG